MQLKAAFFIAGYFYDFCNYNKEVRTIVIV